MATHAITATEKTGLEPLPKRKAWKALQTHYKKIRELHLRNLFSDDPQRGERMTAEAVGLFLDYSKNRITDKTLKILIELAEESGLRARIDAMFRGEKINVTEKRAVLHVALRAPRGTSIFVDGEDVVLQVHTVLDKMTDFSQRLRSGEWNVEPDIWKIEGLDRREDCEKIVTVVRRDGRDKVGCIILGRGESDEKVHESLTTAAGVPGFIGFAVGRTDFWEPLVGWRDKKESREEAVAEIARRYRRFVNVFENARAATSAA